MARLHDITFDCHRPPPLARFWAAALDDYAVAPYGADEDPENDPTVLVEPLSPDQPRLWFQLVPEDKTVKNRVHLDLLADDLDAEVARLVDLGAGVQSRGEHVVLTDPEGNEFCLFRSE